MIVGSQLKKIILICILGTILVSLSHYYALEANQHTQYPSYRAILDNYPLGEVVYVQGSVTEIDSEGYFIIEKYHSQSIVMHVSGELPGELGDEVSLLGVLKPSYHVGDVKRIHVISYRKNDFSLKRSLAAIIFLAIFFSYFWKFDFKRFVFRRR